MDLHQVSLWLSIMMTLMTELAALELSGEMDHSRLTEGWHLLILLRGPSKRTGVLMAILPHFAGTWWQSDHHDGYEV